MDTPGFVKGLEDFIRIGDPESNRHSHLTEAQVEDIQQGKLVPYAAAKIILACTVCNIIVSQGSLRVGS